MKFGAFKAYIETAPAIIIPSTGVAFFRRGINMSRVSELTAVNWTESEMYRNLAPCYFPNISRVNLISKSELPVRVYMRFSGEGQVKWNVNRLPAVSMPNVKKISEFEEKYYSAFVKRDPEYKEMWVNYLE